MSNVFGSCLDKHATWEVVDGQVTFTSNVEGQDPVTLCLDPVKGASINGEPVEVIDGVLQLPTDMFGEGVISADGNTYTLTLPGQDPVDICLNPVKGATLNGEAVTVEEGILILEDMFGSGVVSADGSTYTITLPGQAPVDICLNPVKSVNGVAPDADGAVLLPSSTTVAEPEGFHTITTDDGVATEVCLDPVKTVTTVDANGDVIDGPNAPDADGNASAVGSIATPSADGTQHEILTSDGVITPVCLNPVKSVNGLEPDADGAVVVPSSTTVPAPEGFHTITTDDGVATEVCLVPVKSVNGVTPDAEGAVIIQQATVVDNADGTGDVTDADGNTCTFLKTIEFPADIRVTGITFAESADGSMHDIILEMSDGTTLNAGPVVDADTFAMVADNGDGTGTVTDPAGNACTFVKGPITQATVVDNGDGTATATDSEGNAAIICLDPVKDVLDADGNSVVTDGVAQLPAISEAAEPVTNVDQADGTTLITDPANDACIVPTSIPVKWDGTAFAKGDTLIQREYNDLTQAGEFIKFIDSGDGCTPAPITDCPDLPRMTVSPCTPNGGGDTYCWDGAAWTRIAVNPSNAAKRFLPNVVGDVTTRLTHQDLIDAGTGDTVISSMSYDFTNTDCVAWLFRAENTANMQHNNIGPGLYAWGVLDGGGSIAYSGSGTAAIDNRDTTGTGFDLYFSGNYDMYTHSQFYKLQPGETMTVTSEALIRVFSAYTGPSAGVPLDSSAVSINNHVMHVEMTRCDEKFDPFGGQGLL